MFSIMEIPNTETFMRVVENSRGQVLLHLPDNSLCDLKENRTARQLLRTMRPGEDGLRISLSNSNDAPAFLRYLMEASR